MSTDIEEAAKAIPRQERRRSSGKPGDVLFVNENRDRKFSDITDKNPKSPPVNEQDTSITSVDDDTTKEKNGPKKSESNGLDSVKFSKTPGAGKNPSAMPNG